MRIHLQLKLKNGTNMYNSLAGKVALVTGGTKGIGKSIADKLSKNGATVIITAREDQKVNVNEHYFISNDSTIAGSAQNLAKIIIDKYGRLDIIVNNVGANLSPGGGFDALSDEHWIQDWELNFMSAVRINKAFLPFMIERKSGVVINISTGAAKQPIWEMTMSYSASKAALNVYSKALADELGVHGIRVNVVSPGLVKTPLMMDFIANIAKKSNASQEEVFKSILEKIGPSIQRMAEPEEVADLVNFLVSSDAKYITGINYSIDGGALPVV